MSVEKDRKTAERWLRQAEDDYDTAVLLKNNGKFAQACFLFQQAAEKAVKALWYYYSEEPWGHAVSRLIESFPLNEVRGKFVDELIDDAKELDKFYIPTRYPNGLPEGLMPATAYTERNARDAEIMAKSIVDKMKEVIG